MNKAGYIIELSVNKSGGEPMKENQRIMLTKKLLKEALIKMLQTTSLDKISISALCENAGINRSTFYKYYGSQYDLFEEMENDMLERIQEELSERASLKESLIQICRFLENNREFTLTLTNYNTDRQFPQKLFQLQAIKEQMMLETGSNTDPAFKSYTATFLSFGFFFLIFDWISKEKRETAEEIVEVIVKIQKSIHIE